MVIHTNNHTDSSNDTNNTHSDDDHDEDYIDIDFDNESSLEEEIIPTIFIRALISGGNRYHPEHTKQPLVKIRVRPNCLTKDALGRSIVQAINATTGVAMQYHSLDGDSPIEGMFLEDNGLFVPLDDILHSPLDYNETLFCLSPPQSQTISKSNTLTPPKDPSTTKTPNGLSLFIIAAVTTYLLNQRSQIMLCGECIAAFVIHMLKFILYVPFGFDQIFVHWPLEQLYRHGPSFLGWEGARLSSICARITYYGDESFWLNNMTECERTYAKKVAASMFVRKPMVYFLLCYVTFKVLSLLRSFRKPPKNDPDMEETFQAIHSIVRQLKKAAGKP